MDTQSFYGRKTTRVSTFAEARDLAEESSEAPTIVILPPNSGDIGNQESDLEECPEEEYESAGELEVEEDTESDSECENLPTQKKTSKGKNVIWKKNSNFKKPMQVGYENINEKLELHEGKTPYEVWQSVFSNEILKHIVSQTNLFANRDKNNDKFIVSEIEMQKILGIFLLSGYHTVPEEKQYWSTQPDLHVDIVSKSISRNRT